MDNKFISIFKTDDPCATCIFREKTSYEYPCISCSEIDNGEDSNHRLIEEIEKVVEELESKAAKWNDPQTQADLELAAAVKKLFETGQHHLIQTYKGCRQAYFYDERMLIDWCREQKRGAE